MDDATYDEGFDEPGSKPRRPGLPVEPRRVLRILLRHRRRLGAAFLVASAVSLIAFFFVPRTYQANAVLLYEGMPLLDVDGPQATPDAFVKSAVVPSRLREVRARLGWGVSLDALEEQTTASLESEISMRLAAKGSTGGRCLRARARRCSTYSSNTKPSSMLRRSIDSPSRTTVSIERATERRDDAQAAFDEFRRTSGKSDLLDEKEQLLKRAAELRSRGTRQRWRSRRRRRSLRSSSELRKSSRRQIVASATKGSPIDSLLSTARAELARGARNTERGAPPSAGLEGASCQSAVAEGHASRRGRRPDARGQSGARVGGGAARERPRGVGRRLETRSALEVLLANIQREADVACAVGG